MSHDPIASSTDARQELARQQAQLIRALKAGQASNGQWDVACLSTAAESLLNKRTRAIEKMWPQIAASMNGQLRRLVREYAGDHPFAADGPEDGMRFARWLLRGHEISDDIRVALLAGLTQSGFPVRVMFLRKSSSVAVAWRSPWGRVRVLRFRR